MTSVLEGYMFAKQGAIDGRARGTKSRLAQLAGQAYSDPSQRQSALAEMVATDPGAGMAFGKQMQDDEDGVHDQIIKRATMVSRAYKTNPQMAQAMYQGLPELASRGGFGQVPAQLDDKVAMALEQMVAAASKPADDYTLSPGARRFDANNQMVAEAPVAPQRRTLVNVPDGQGGMMQMEYDGKNLSQPQYPGQQQAQPQGPSGGASNMMEGAYQEASRDPQAIQADYRSMAPQFGAQISSLTRSPQHNAKVGGVANSQHVPRAGATDGTAGDFVVPQDKKAAFIAAARQKGYEAIDEGDHVHVELPPGGGRQVAQAGRMGYTPPKQATQDKPSALQERIRIARESGATPEQIQRLVLGSAAPKPTTTGGVNSQKLQQSNATKMAQFNTAERAIKRLETAANSIASNKMFDGGPMDKLVLGKLPQGQELEQAGASLLPVLTALTRVPGVGAQSDLESRLASMQMPSAEFPPDVNKRAVVALRAYIRDLRSAYQTVGPAPQQQPATGGFRILPD